MNLANRLQALIKQKQINASKLSKATGIAQPIIHRLVSGKTINPQLSTLLSLADYFNIELDVLIGRKPLDYPTLSNIPQLDMPEAPLISFEWFREDASRSQHFADIELNSPAFAIQIEDERFNPLVQKGFYILFNTNRKTENLDYVLLQPSNQNCLTIRQLIIDGGSKYLRPIPPQLPSRMLSQGDQILAVVSHIIHAHHTAKMALQPTKKQAGDLPA